MERSKSAETPLVKSNKKSTAKRPKSENVRELLRAASKSAMLRPPSDTPVITVTSLSPQNDEDIEKYNQRRPMPMKRTHKITKSSSKITVHSSVSPKERKYMKNQSDTADAEMKQLWLKKLRELLDEQNKILQQEK